MDAFWRGVEGESDKRGQVRALSLPARIPPGQSDDCGAFASVTATSISAVPLPPWLGSSAIRACLGGARRQIVVTFSEKRPRKTWFLMGEVSPCFISAAIWKRVALVLSVGLAGRCGRGNKKQEPICVRSCELTSAVVPTRDALVSFDVLCVAM